MKYLSIGLLLLISQLSIGNPGAIKKINVYMMTKGQEHYMQINESNIKSAASTKFQIDDSLSLARIESSLKDLKKATSQFLIGGIYMLCEIIFKSGARQVLSFQDKEHGLIKRDLLTYNNLPGLEGMILFSKSTDALVRVPRTGM